MNRRQLLTALLCEVVALCGCGYHAGGRADLVPKSVQTIAIPAFASSTLRYKLVDVLPQQIGREFIARTRFHVVTDTNDADAVLSGSVNSAQVFPTIFDPTSAKATSVQVQVLLSIDLRERSTGRSLFSKTNMAFRQNYSIAVDPHQFFDESGPAFDRVSQDVARDIVSAIVEAF